MLQCVECGEFGTVDDPSEEEWSEAFHAPAHPYPWHDESRITVRPEHRPRPDYWARQMDLRPKAKFLDVEIGQDDDSILSLFDGSSGELEIVAIDSNLDSNGRILTLKSGAVVNQVKEGGKWRCIAFVGPVPRAIGDQYFGDQPESE
jgi:hypothetical protein